MYFSFQIKLFFYIAYYIVTTSRSISSASNIANLHDAVSPDSCNTSFVSVLPYNDGASNCTIILINCQNVNTTVTVNYRRLSDGHFVKSNFTVNLLAFGFEKIEMDTLALTFPPYQSKANWFIDSRFYVDSKTPISVVVTTHNDKGIGDAYTLIPKAKAGTNYALSLPAASMGDYSLLYFIPIKDMVLNIRLLTQNISYQYSAFIPAADESKIMAFAFFGEQFTAYIDGDSPFHVLAMIRRIKSFSNLIDFGCFMPQPLLRTECAPQSVYDAHIAPLNNSSYLFLTPPTIESGKINISLYGSNALRQVHINSKEMQHLEEFGTNEFGKSVEILATDCLLQIMDLGSYNVNGGLYLDLIPSLSQMVTGTVPFYVPTNDNKVMMIGDEATLATGKFDDQQKFIGVLLSNFEKNFYYGSTTLSQGIHKFQSDGQFTIFISGSFSNGSYGYTPAYNAQKDIPYHPPPNKASQALYKQTALLWIFLFFISVIK